MYSPVIVFKKDFNIEVPFKSAYIKAVSLGLGEYYLNDNKMNNDILTTPVSDYSKRVWIRKYDCTNLIKHGSNVITVLVGNGFYSENFKSGWSFDKAEWRGEPTLYLELYIDNKLYLESNETWLSGKSDRIYYNELRSGEYVNFNYVYDSADYYNAIKNNKISSNLILNDLECEPIKEFNKNIPKRIIKKDDGYIVDFGVNLSGNIELKIKEKKNALITIEYSEDLDENDNLRLNGLEIYQLGTPFQKDSFITSGEEDLFKPLFTYHGFRYAYIKGLSSFDSIIEIYQVFIHEDIDRLIEFKSSDENLNKLYEFAINSCYSNMFYSMTDCPTREKLGWLNDSNASAPQLLLNFEIENMFVKWFTDFIDAIKEDGSVPGIVPSPNWGYDYGPICNAAYIMMPYNLYLYKNNKKGIELLIDSMDKYYKYFKNNFGTRYLGDWTGGKVTDTPYDFIEKTYAVIYSEYLIKCHKIIDNNYDISDLENDLEKHKNNMISMYVKDGYSVVENETCISTLLCLGLGNKKLLQQQLVKVIEKEEYHITTGMFGVQFLYKALKLIGRSDITYKMVFNNSYPSFKFWLDENKGTLFESFDDVKTLSKNHHMFSNVVEWIINDCIGIEIIDNNLYRYTKYLTNEVKEVFANIKLKNGSIIIDRAGDTTKINVCGDIKVLYEDKIIQNEEIVL